ncbi:MAG: hypothetical protein LBU39_05160 [Desulfobulbaceae bacterium]|jgi:outer membrane protein assembly factor BamD (BamD/ComL family)|nr:hypothetical protein [Desulfobulbaceae bacterium]
MSFRIFLFSIIFLLAAPAFSQEAVAATLEKITVADNHDLRQVFFSFSELPRHSQNIGGRRIDLRFFNTEAAPDLAAPPEDDRVVKVLRQRRDGALMYSFFLRYPPRNATLTATKDKRLVLDITLMADGRYPPISRDAAKDTTASKETTAADNPLAASPWRKNWLLFMRDYESAIDPIAPMLFSLPPYPMIALLPPGRAENIAFLPEGARQADAASGALTAILLEAIAKETDEKRKKLLALTYGEALLRAGDFNGAYKQLYLLAEQYQNEQTGIFAAYLLNRLLAQYQDAGQAHFALNNLAAKMLPSNPLAPWFRLLQIETALADGDTEAAGQLLNKEDIGFPPEAEELRDLRQGDYLAATGKDIQAFVRYRLMENETDRRAHPFSQNGYCNILYTHRRFADAAACYGQLAEVISGDAALAMTGFRQAMARLRADPQKPPSESFTRIAYAYPDTEASRRAAMKSIDLMVLADHNKMEIARRRYQEIVNESVKRDIRAEATIKIAILSILQNKNGDAVTLLMEFLRDDRMSDLRQTATALLIQCLPDEIRRLVAEGDAMDALVLAKQNRELFAKRWLHSDVLIEVAKSYQDLGIWKEAQGAWLYLLEINHDPERQQFFLPLVLSTFQRGEYSQAEEYAAQYAYNYPDGQDREAILRLRLASLLALRQYDKILSLLPSPLPDDREIHTIAAGVSFQRDDFKAVADLLRDEERAEPTVTRNLYMLAESRYRLGDLSGAMAIFPRIQSDATYGDEATYRLATIAHDQGESGKELEFLRQLAARPEDSPWRAFARKSLEARPFIDRSTGG